MYSRNKLRQKKSLIGLTKEESKKLVEITKEFKSYHDLTLDKQSQLIKNVRRIIDTQRDKAEIFLGGLPMIISDMIDFIQHDLEVFGFGVICFLVLALVFFFGKLRWVLLPIFCCSITKHLVPKPEYPYLKYNRISMGVVRQLTRLTRGMCGAPGATALFS